MTSRARHRGSIGIVAFALLVAAVSMGCERPAGNLFRATVAGPEGEYPMPVVLGDQTGLVVSVEPAQGVNPDQHLPNIQPDPTDPNALILSWGTGACDDESVVLVKRSGTGLRLDVEVRNGFSLGCMGLLVFRGLRIKLSTPIPDSIEAFGGLS